MSTDLNGKAFLDLELEYWFNLALVTYLNSGGQVGDVLKAIVKCDKCKILAIFSTN